MIGRLAEKFHSKIAGLSTPEASSCLPMYSTCFFFGNEKRIPPVLSLVDFVRVGIVDVDNIITVPTRRYDTGFGQCLLTR